MENFGFVGRTKEKKDFGDLLQRLSTTPLPHFPLLMYYGQSGSGKSTFLQQLQMYCDEKSVSWVALNIGSSSGSATPNPRTILEVVKLLAEAAKRDCAGGVKLSLLKKLIADTEKVHRDKASLDSADATGILGGIVSAGTGIMLGGSEITAAVTIATSTALTVVKRVKNWRIDVVNKHLARQHEDYWLMRFVDCFDGDPQHPIKTVMFLDTGEADLRDGTQFWLQTLYSVLSERGFLLVIAGLHELTHWDSQTDDIRNILIAGFTEAEADKYISRAEKQFRKEMFLSQEMPEAIREGIKQYSLSKTETVRRRTARYYQPIKIDLCFTSLSGELKSGRGYPKFLHLSHDKVWSDLRKGWENSPHRRVTDWLPVLAHAPSFDEGLAKKVYDLMFKNAKGMERDADWDFLIASRILTQRVNEYEDKKEYFYEMHEFYRGVFSKEAKAEDIQTLHKTGAKHWIERASEELSEYGVYVTEQPSWQKMVALCLFHGQKSRRSSDKSLNDTDLLILGFLLETYWWWGESVPQAYWNRLVDDTIQALADNNQHIKLKDALQILTEFDLAWPKMWMRDPRSWAPRHQWNHSVVLQKMDELRGVIGFNSKIPVSSDTQKLRQWLDGIISSYEGHAFRYLARTQPDPETFVKKAKEAFQRLATRGEIGVSKSTNVYKTIWSLIALAELYTDAEEFAQAEGYAKQALDILGEMDEDEEGVQREGSSNAYHVLNTIAMCQKKWKTAGKMMGLALVFSFGFYASDQDEYSHAYRRYQQECAQDDLKAIYEHSPDGALEYLCSLQEQWQGNSHIDGINVPSEELVKAFMETLPIELDGEPDATSEEVFAEAEARFGRLRQLKLS